MQFSGPAFFLFISVTSRLNLFFRNYVFSDTSFSAGLFVHVMLFTLLRPGSMIQT